MKYMQHTNDPDLAGLPISPTPATGVIEGHYYNPASPEPYVYFGYDCASGAFYRIGGQQIWMRDNAGKYWKGDSGGMKTWPPEECPSDSVLEQYLPWLATKAMLRTPEIVKSVEHRPDGTWVVDLLIPMGGRERAEERCAPYRIDMPSAVSRLILDKDGNVVRLEAPDHPEYHQDITYAKDAPPGVTVRDDLGWGSRLEHVELKTDPGAAAIFEADKVFAFAKSVRFNAEYLDPPMRYDQATGKLVPSASQVAPNGLTHFLEAATYRNVLVGVGVLLCLIAAAAYWKRKKSQSRAGRPG